MQALQPVLVQNTNIQQTVVESALDAAEGAGFPGVILSCPRSVEQRRAMGKKSETHTIHVQLLDVWDSNTRTVQQLTQDLRTNLEQMKANVRASRQLSGGVVSAGETMETQIDGVIKLDGLPFPMGGGQLLIDVADAWFTA